MLARWHPPIDRSAGLLRHRAAALAARRRRRSPARVARGRVPPCAGAHDHQRGARGLAHAVPLHDQRLPGLQPRLHVLLRAPDARVPRAERRPTTSSGASSSRSTRSSGCAAELARPRWARRAHRDGHEYRSVPAVRGPLPAHPRHRRDARRGAESVLDPHEVDAWSSATCDVLVAAARAHRRTRELLDRHARRAASGASASPARPPRAGVSRRWRA